VKVTNNNGLYEFIAQAGFGVIYNTSNAN